MSVSASSQQMVRDAEQLVAALDEAGVVGRLLGGLAVALRCPSAREPSPLARDYSDFDVVVDKDGRRRLPDVVRELGFEGVDRFNAMNGQVRQLYRRGDGVELDVFVERFSLCHELDLKDRLALDARTLTLADLVLTKLQVAELTEKDVVDVAAMTLDHELTDDDGGIGVQRIASVTGGDWGWWKTVTDNLEKVLAHAGRLPLEAAGAARVAATTQALRERIDAAPKSLRWKARAKVGERMAWRQEPDEKR